MQHAAARPVHVAARVSRRHTQGARWRLKLATGESRNAVERFISRTYAAAYAARIEAFMPAIAGVYRDEELLAACGLREASGEALFLETYLDQPVEIRLGDLTGSSIDRTRIVEIGNLAIARPGAARVLISLLTEHLAVSGFEWTVFTAVPALRNNFAGLAIPLFELGPARPERLHPAARAAWGRYYECSPQVSAVRVADAAKALRAHE